MSELSFQVYNFGPRFGSGPDLTKVITAAADAGFTGIGLDHWSVRAYQADGRTVGGLEAFLDGRGLTCTDLQALAIGSDLAQALENATDFCHMASALGAPICIVALTDGAPPPGDRRVRDTLRRIADVLEPADIRIALEYLPYSTLSTVAAAVELCADIGWDRAGLLVDSWHTLVTDQLGELDQLDAGQVAFVQVSDAVLPLGEDLVESSRHHRLIPGQGNFDLSGFTRALEKADYTGAISAEVLSQLARTEGPEAFAPKLMEGMKAYWA